MTTLVFITVEGLALPLPASTSSRQYRFSSGSFSGDVDGAYVPCIPQGSLPNEVATAIDPHESTQTTGGMSVELAATPAVLAAFFDGRPVGLAALTSDMNRTQTTVDTDDTTGALSGSLVVLERELLMIGSHSGSGTYVCARAQGGTTATPHSASNVDGYPVLLAAAHFPVSRQRRVTMGVVFDDGAQSDYSAEQTLWTGLLDGVSMTGSVVTLSLLPLWSIFDNATICKDLWTGTPTSTGVFTTRRTGTPVASSGLLHVACDKLTVMSRCTYRVDGGITTVFLPDTPAAPHPALSRDELQSLKRVTEIHRCSNAGTSTYPPSRNAITLCLQVLMTTDHGENYDPAHTSYDLGVEDLGLAIPYDMIDVPSFENVRASLGDLADCNNLYLGIDGKPVKVLDLFQNLLRPLGVVLAQNFSGQITCVRLLDSTDNPAAELDSSNILTDPNSGGAYPTHTPRLDLALDVLDVAWDWKVKDGTRTDTYRHATRLTQTLQPAENGLELGHTSDEPLVRTLAVWNITRYARPMPQIDISVLRTVSVDIGDLVTLSLDSLGIRGDRGVTNLVCLVVARRLVLDVGAIRLRLWGVGHIYDRTGVIAPAARIVSYKNGAFGPSYTVEHNAFTRGTVDGYATDASAFRVGDRVDLCSRSHAVRDAEQVVTSVTANTIGVSSAPAVTPNAGDILKLSPYSSQVDVGSWAYLYDSALLWTPYNWTT